MKLSLVGIGRVGITLAYTLIVNQRVDDLVLVGKTTERGEAEALDLSHAQLFSGNRATIRAGTVEDTKNSDVIVVSASCPMAAGVSSRLDFIGDNAEIFKAIIPGLAKNSPDAVLLIITNPVDVMTYAALKLSGFPKTRVFGTGTLIDSARFRRLLADEVNIHPMDLRAYILGEHGDSQFPLFSEATAGAAKMKATQKRVAMFEQARSVGYEVQKKKGYTNFAIAAAAAYIVASIVDNQCRTIPVSLFVEDFLDVGDVCLSLPAVIGRHGIERILYPDLSEEETKSFHRSARAIQDAIAALKI